LPPPAWRADGRSSIAKRESVFDAFLWFGDVRKLTAALAEHLLSVQGRTSNKPIRDRRKELAEAIAEQLALFGATLRERYPVGWTHADDCRLPQCERLWLDPERADPERPGWATEDEAFKAEYDRGDWADEVATRFSLWLNDRMRKAGLVTMALPELEHWVSNVLIDVAWPVPQRRRANVEAFA